MNHRLSVAAAAASTLFLALPASADFVVPTSYTLTAAEGQNEGGSYNYFDDGNSQLTDGILGVNDWSANIDSKGNAQEWVGWRLADPIASFNFAAPTTISQVQIGFNRSQGSGIFLPPSVTINGQLFALTGTELPDGTRGFVNFDVNFTGTTLPLSLADGTAGAWIFIDEVRFVSPAVTVPESGTFALALPALGMIGTVVIAKRRRK